MWLPRLLLWLGLAYIGVRLALDPLYWSLFHPLDLAVHEGGHLLFGYFGELIGAAGGTILQVLAPVAAMVMFYRQRDYFAIAVCIVWLGINLSAVGVYMGDALRMELPLVTVGQEDGIVKHDWSYLFGRMGLLRQAEGIGWLTRGLGDVVMLAGLALAAWLMKEMMGWGGKKNSGVGGTWQMDR
jgi:hypothetical protein